MSGLFDVMKKNKNALQAFEASLRIHTSNSANMATKGYKALTHTFKTVFNTVIQRGGMEVEDFGGQNPVQYGSGVSIANIQLDFSQGDLGEGGALDMAISGRGLFVLDANFRSGANNYLYSRNGEFSVDTTGKYIVDSSGRQLMGYKILEDGTVDKSKIVPIKTEGYNDLGWQTGGILVANYTPPLQTGSSETETALPMIPLYQAVVTDFVNAEGLLQYDGTAFEESVSSGGPTIFNTSGEVTLGLVVPQQLESSNVFFIGETIDAIEVQRAINASLSAIKTASDIISQVINRLGGG